MNVLSEVFGPAEKVSERSWFCLDDVRLTHRQVYFSTVLTAQMLKSWGIQPNDRVIMAGQASFAYIYNYLALLFLGAVVIPMSPDHAVEEIAYAANKSRAGWVLGDGPLARRITGAGSLPEVRVREITCPDDAPAETADLQPHPVDADQVAQILFTSGTTGRPKGAMITHGGLLANVRAVNKYNKIHGDDVVLGALPLTHCYGVTHTVLSPLLAHASVALMPKFSPTRALEWFRERRITMFPAVPAMLNLLLLKEDLDQIDFSPLRYCLSGGMATPRTTVQEFKRRTGVSVLEGYGITEASSFVAGQDASKPDNVDSTSVGYPIDGVKLRIVSQQDPAVLLGPGEIGRLEVWSPSLMKGYINDEEATVKVLRNGWLLTGDLGWLSEDGELFLAGREKEMINRGGLKIYPLEVEKVLRDFPGIRDAAVVPVSDPILGERVKAVIERVAGAQVDQEQVREFVMARVAGYKVPELWEVRDALPRNSVGKVVKSQL